MRELVTDVEDPRLADYARLTDMELRISMESAQGLFIAEGTKVIGRAVAAGLVVLAIYLRTFFFPATVFFGPLRVRALVWVL